jgi:HK97 family phage prohead protease
MNEHIRAAAEARASGAQYAARGLASRPTERRAGEDPSSFRGLVTSVAPQMRAAADSASGTGFWGLACRVDYGYEMYDWAGPYVESVDPGAFASSLARADLDVPLVLQHVDLRRIARTTIPAGEVGHLSLTETPDGLECFAPQLDLADPDVDYIKRKIERGLVTEMSFKFRITKGQWSPDWSEYHIQEVDIHRGDVAICGYGANPNTLAEVRESLAARVARASEDEVREVLAACTERVQIGAPRPANWDAWERYGDFGKSA